MLIRKSSGFLSTSMLLVALVSLNACSGGGGSSGLTSGGVTNAASGVLSLPSATCGSNACVSSVSGLGALSTNSAAVLHQNAEFGYNYINATFIPLVNQKMYQVEQAFKDSDLDQCGSSDVLLQSRQIDQVPDNTYPLNATTSVVVSSTGLHSAPYAMEKKFIISMSGSPTVEVQVGCPSTTTRSIYVRVKDGANLFEAWGHQSPIEKVIYAASDVGTEKRTLYFKSSSANVFEVAAIVKDASLNGGSPISVAISGGADLASVSGKLEVNFLTNAATSLSVSSGTTYAADEAPYAGSNRRHCYTALSPEVLSTTTSHCAPLFAGPDSVYLRGSVRTIGAWSVQTLGSASISNSF